MFEPLPAPVMPNFVPLRKSGRSTPVSKFPSVEEIALVDLIEAGLQSRDAEKERFFLLAGRLTETSDAGERRRLKEELARMTFGD